MSIHADDEFNLRLALMSELDDVTPRDGLAGLVVARYRKGRRRRFAGVFGLFVVFAGIGVPIGIAGTSGGTSARSGPVTLRLGSYTLTLPDRYHVSDPAAAPCAAAAAAAAAADPAPHPAGAQLPEGDLAAASSGACILMVLAPALAPGQADPNIPRGSRQITVGRYRAWLAPRGYLPAGDGTALIVQAGPAGSAAADRDLMIRASGLSRAALVSLIAAGLSAA